MSTEDTMRGRSVDGEGLGLHHDPDARDEEGIALDPDARIDGVARDPDARSVLDGGARTGGGMIADDSGREPEVRATMVTHEERLQAGTRTEHAGTVRVKKRVENRHVEDHVPRQSEEADVERMPAAENDSGQVEELPDGSVSIPVLEEEIVVTKRTVVRERIVIRKRTLVEQFKVSGDVRVEHVDVETDTPELLEEVTRPVR